MNPIIPGADVVCLRVVEYVRGADDVKGDDGRKGADEFA